jgi:hypothetical protein
MAFSTHYPIQKILLLFDDFCEGKKQFHSPDPRVPTTLCDNLRFLDFQQFFA